MISRVGRAASGAHNDPNAISIVRLHRSKEAIPKGTAIRYGPPVML
jgi:hypothetical protein